jgi:putative transposase
LGRVRRQLVQEVSTSGYYARQKRPPSARARAAAALSARITAIHQHSRTTYGTPRIHVELQEQGIRVGRKRVARMCCSFGGGGW